MIILEYNIIKYLQYFNFIDFMGRDATRVKASKKKQVTEYREGRRARQRRQISSKDYGSGLLL